MEFMYLFWNGGDDVVVPTPEETRQEMSAYVFDLVGKGKLKGGSPLHPPTEAKTVTARKDKVAATDGPYTETKEVIGGYLIVEADSIGEAVEMARTCPAAKWGAVEVREVLPVG